MYANILSQKIIFSSLVISSTLIANIMPVMSQPVDSERMSFFCGKIFDQANNNYIPATLVWIPERQENVRLIAWKSNYWDKTIPIDERCQIVTQKFQAKYDNGDLQYFTFGKYNGYPIICVVKNMGDRCNGDSQLFTLKPHSNPQGIIEQLSGIFGGNLGDVLYQNSGDLAYIPFKYVLKESRGIHPTDDTQ
jgi:hypothetical protein